MKYMIAAHDRDRAIGKNGEIPWAKLLPADMQRFRDLTMGGSVIMGRKTYESLPERYRPLPGRQNIVLSMGRLAGAGFQVAHSLDEAYAIAEHEQVHIIGGGQIYDLAMDSVDQINITEVDTLVNDPDAHFPAVDSMQWHETERETFAADEKNAFGYSFVTYLRNHPIV